MSCMVFAGVTPGELRKGLLLPLANVPSNLLSGPGISEASAFPFYHNDPFFTGQKTSVCILAAAKFIHPNYVLKDHIHDQMVSLQIP